MNNVLSAEEFYDSFAPQYDAMTGYVQRLEAEKEILRPIVAEYQIARAADLGCGTGVHTLALASLGVRSIGFDLAGNMIALAEKHASMNKISASFARADFISDEIMRNAPYDAMVCLGNSLPHIPTRGLLGEVFSYWKQCLAPNGILLLQILNYQRIVRLGERIVGIRKSGNTTTLRFYDFTEPQITFNILTLVEEGDSISHELQSTLLLPIVKTDILEIGESSGFGDIRFYSSLKREVYHEDAKDVVAVMRV